MTEATTILPPDTLRRRFAKADRERLMRHAEALESQMRSLAAILEFRDAGGHGTTTSEQLIRGARELAAREA